MRRVEQRHSDGRGREGGEAGNPTGRAEAAGGREGEDGSGGGSGSSRAREGGSGVESTKRLHKKKNRLRSFSIQL